MAGIIQKRSRNFSAAAATRLAAWYRRHRRDLPWRRTRDPYRIWISEVMLQQTQVATVIAYYERFVRRFPSLRALAAAREEEVLAAWSGLGYYRRARNLHAAAREIVARHSGILPADPQALRALPGIGSYTAGAVASIGFDRPEPALDGNAERVLTRLLALRGDVASARVRRRLEEVARALLSCGKPSEITQALMELGALLCSPASPRCARCPLRGACRARAAGIQEQLPQSKPSRPAVRRQSAVAIVRSGGAYLMVRRSEPGLMQGLWEFPGDFLGSKESATAGLRRVGRERLGRALEAEREIARLTQTITYRRIRVSARAAQLSEPAPGGWQLPRNARWLTPARAQRLPHGSLTARLLALLEPAPSRRRGLPGRSS
jgi:A/G-specific adenine glycosylase